MRDLHPTRIHFVNNKVKLNPLGMPYSFRKLMKIDSYCGHLNYSPPETLAGRTEGISEKVDIWALGCCLYFISAKKDPFESQ